MFGIKKEACTDCQMCVDACPCDAIIKEDGKVSYIDPKLCVDCGACADVCEFDSIFEAPLEQIEFMLANNK